jgi:hypothetical protein
MAAAPSIGVATEEVAPTGSLSGRSIRPPCSEVARRTRLATFPSEGSVAVSRARDLAPRDANVAERPLLRVAARAGLDVIGLQRSAGNRAVARLLAQPTAGGAAIQRIPVGYKPAAIFGDWREAIGDHGIRGALEHYVYRNTNVSDRDMTFEDEIEAALALEPEHLVNAQDAHRLQVWQGQLRRPFNMAKQLIDGGRYDEAIKSLGETFDFALLIYGLPMQAPQFDVTWKRQIVPGRVTTRATGARMEALLEVTPSGSNTPQKKNLNVSLRRHWWSGLTAESVANPAGNSLMGPEVSSEMIRQDIETVATEYSRHVSSRGYSGEFGVDCPSGVHYHVNRLDNQQPHCFPNRGTATVGLAANEFTAAVRLKLYREATEHNRRLPAGVSVDTVRAGLRAAPGVIDKLKSIGVAFGSGFLKPLLPTS